MKSILVCFKRPHQSGQWKCTAQYAIQDQEDVWLIIIWWSNWGKRHREYVCVFKPINSSLQIYSSGSVLSQLPSQSRVWQESICESSTCHFSRIAGLPRTCRQTRSTLARWRGKVTWPTWSWTRRSSRACWTCPRGWPSTACAATRPPSGWVTLVILGHHDTLQHPGQQLVSYSNHKINVKPGKLSMTSIELSFALQASSCQCLFVVPLPVCVTRMQCCNYKAHIWRACACVWSIKFLDSNLAG